MRRAKCCRDDVVEKPADNRTLHWQMREERRSVNRSAVVGTRDRTSERALCGPALIRRGKLSLLVVVASRR
jgi:hypothetical protein